MNILLSVHPEYVRMIERGIKVWEFRKREIPIAEKIFIYETAPSKRIVGYFTRRESTHYWCGTPNYVYDRCSLGHGLSLSESKEYANGGTIWAHYISGYTDLKPVDPWKIRGFRPPQSFYYLRPGSPLTVVLNRTTNDN